MKIELKYPEKKIVTWTKVAIKYINLQTIFLISLTFSVAAILYSYTHDYIVSYGDAESHLNIAKRVISSVTPGFAQLGGIWLPLPHILMIPFVYFDFLWRSGLAGSIVGGSAYIISCIFIYRTALYLTKNKVASLIAFLIFALNPNILYIQSTPMTEPVLILFFILSSYYFIKFLRNDGEIPSLILAAVFGFCASLSRYDGWFLVLAEALAIILKYLPNWKVFKEKIESNFILFSTVGFFGVLLWFLWGLLILGDPLYFTHSQFSAKSQQANWFARGELPAYQHLVTAINYYAVTVMANLGVVVAFIALVGFIYFLLAKKESRRYLISFIFFVPFIFNVVTLYLGQSVIFIPHLTPVSFEWRLFNVRYGTLMVPVAGIFLAYLFSKVSPGIKALLIGLCAFQVLLYIVGYSQPVTLNDGLVGLSRAKRPDAEGWMKKHYDNGFVLMDDYARTISILRSGVPMQEIIYIGNKPYWEDSLATPQKYATWIVMQKDDSVWKAIYTTKAEQDNLYKYFQKAYTSTDILIFKRIIQK